MVPLYAIAVFLGFVGVAGWVLAGTLASNPDSTVQDPMARFGERLRTVVTATLGFGLGGMSASYAGWPGLAAIAAALGGAALLVISIRLIEAGEPEG